MRPRIAAAVTVEDFTTPDRPVDPKVEMLGQVIGAQIELERALSELVGRGGNAAEIAAQLGILSGLQRAITTSDRSGLAALRNEVAGMVASAQSLAENVRAAADGSAGEDPSDRRMAAKAALAALEADLFDRRVLDPYLHFSSKADEEDYCRREAERHREIERAKAEGTPAGDARVAALTLDQVRDAGNHGATASPEYTRLLRTAETAEEALRVTSPRETARANSPATPAIASNAQDDLSDVMAAMHEAGVTTSAVNDEPAHGLTAGMTPAPGRSI